MFRRLLCRAAIAALFACPAAHAAPQFVNALVLDGAAVDASGGTAVNDGRLGYFSDLYHDPLRNEWWALSDRGPGGGTLPYETRIHRFRIDVDPTSGAISNFQVLQTLLLRRGGQAFDGISPGDGNPLGMAFDPEGVVVHPANGHLLVSDEYGPSVVQLSRHGALVRRYHVPTGVLPRHAGSGAVNHASDSGNTAGKRTNRGFEGLAINPSGSRLYAMLQSAMLDEGGADGVWVRIVEFDTGSGRALAQYAYRMEGASQGRGISALVALNDHEFLVLERNNRGIGVDANLAPPNKKVFRIDLRGASDVSAVNLARAGASFTPVAKEATPWLDLAAAATLAHPSLASLAGSSPEKWEGLAIGPRLADGSYLVLAGTDNDYSLTQNASGVQRDVYFKPGATGGAPTRIQCDIGTLNNCLTVATDGSVGAPVPADFAFDGFRLIPGVLHAYKASAADLAGYVPAGTRAGR